MNLKSLILFILLVTFPIFSGCSDSPDTPQTSSVTLVITTHDVQTKSDAGAADGYNIATSDEIIIQKYMVAIFKGDTCVAFKETTPTSTTTTTDEATGNTVSAYSETFTDLPASTLTFLVMANYSVSLNGLGVGSRYADFENLSDEASSMDSNNLLKVGQTTANLSSSNEALSVNVSLTQLPVRIDFGTVSIKKENEETVDSKTTLNGDWQALDQSDVEAAALLTKSKLSGGSWSDKYYYVGDFYKYLFQKRTVTVTTSSSSGQFIVNSKKVSGYNMTTDLILNPDINTIENSQFSAGNEINFTKSFYTYESSDASKRITMTVNCKISESEVVKTYVQYSYIRYTKVNDEWNAGVETDFDIDESAPLTTETSDDSGLSYDYTISLPFNANGISLLKGHRYTVNGTFTQKLLGKPTVDWYISDLGPVANELDYN